MASSATAASPSSLTLSQSLSLSRSLPAISQHPHRISLPTVNLSATSLKCSRRVGSRAAAVRASAAVDVAEKTETGLVEKSVNTIRFLAIDAVEKANSGHPGLPMGCAPMGHILYDEIMKYNPKNPFWFNRDRFVLSAGHGCMLQYALLHLAGYDSVKFCSQPGDVVHPKIKTTQFLTFSESISLRAEFWTDLKRLKGIIERRRLL